MAANSDAVQVDDTNPKSNLEMQDVVAYWWNGIRMLLPGPCCALALVVVALSVLFVGCGKREPIAVAEPPRGEPIKGAPIRSEVAAATTTNTPSTNTAVAARTNAPVAVGNLPKDGEHLVVGFDTLASYTYEMPDETGGPSGGKPQKDQIPAEIRSLNDKPIALKGFMLPLKVEAGRVTELLLMRDQSMCCYGAVPKINEWVSVKMGEGAKPVMDAPVTVYGKLQVGEMRENGYLVGLYQMAGEKIKE